ncbi:MAG TPA: threonine synthase, partial [Miltoncostaeaceae bacterium]|nr:threonine synthase [Miltoncostaeaceae bacterium]
MIALIDRYREFLPVTDATRVISLGEGNTPLVPLERLSERFGVELYAKYEGMNPTGSFKDRGMCMAITKAVEEGARAVICASTGNTSASAAAYAAKAGITAAVVIPDGKIAAGKLAQALIYGAQVLSLAGSFDDALTVVRELADRHPIALVNSVNEYRIDGQRTAAFEICDELGDAPDALCIPVGNAGNISAYWLGFQQYRQAERSQRLPRMYGTQAAGAAPLVVGHPVAHPETIATAIRIGNPARGDQAMAAMN